MAKLEKSYSREQKRKKRQHGMRVDGRSVFDIQRVQADRGSAHKRAPKKKGGTKRGTTEHDSERAR